MKKSAKYEICGYHFASKKEIINHVRDLLSSNGEGFVFHPEDQRFLEEIVMMHPRVDEKIGSGISQFVVFTDDGGKTYRFEIERLDGTMTDISYLKCINGEPKGNRQISAFRWAVYSQVQDYKRAVFSQADENGMVKCAFTGKRITREEAHVDHAYPFTFKRILQDFLKYKGLTLEAIEVIDHPTWIKTKILKKEDLACEFAEYHKKKAKLRIISGKSNMSFGARKPPQKITMKNGSARHFAKPAADKPVTLPLLPEGW